jgi:hypothetical protein
LILISRVGLSLAQRFCSNYTSSKNINEGKHVINTYIARARKINFDILFKGTFLNHSLSKIHDFYYIVRTVARIMLLN